MHLYIEAFRGEDLLKLTVFLRGDQEYSWGFTLESKNTLNHTGDFQTIGSVWAQTLKDYLLFQKIIRFFLLYIQNNKHKI